MTRKAAEFDVELPPLMHLTDREVGPNYTKIIKKGDFQRIDHVGLACTGTCV
jgi:hypothetical protein